MGRTQISGTPSARDATNAIWRPSGETASCGACTDPSVGVNTKSGGGARLKATSGAGGRRSWIVRSPKAPSAIRIIEARAAPKIARWLIGREEAAAADE